MSTNFEPTKACPGLGVSERKILGIDNGLDGGLVLLAESGKVLQREVMPTVDVKGSRRVYDEGAIVRLIRAWDPSHAFVEKAQPMPAGIGMTGHVGEFAKGLGYGTMRGILAALSVPYELVHVKTWQSRIFNGLAKSDTKAQSVLVAARLFPSTEWRATPRCKKAHNGLTDAALIAEYGRRLLGGRPDENYDYSKPIDTGEEDAEEIAATLGDRSTEGEAGGLF